MTVGHNGVNNIRDGKAEWVADDAAPARRTVDTITDDELDALYERLHLLDGMRQSNLDAACAAVARAEAAEAAVREGLAVAEVIEANGIGWAADSIRRALSPTAAATKETA